MNRPDSSSTCDRERGRVTHRLVLSFVLGLLGVLILMVTANAYVARKIEDSLADFDSGTFIDTGLLDLPAEDIHSVQLLPVGLTGQFRESAHKLPQKLTNLAVVANGDVLYVIGGTGEDNEPRQTVYSSIITGPNGELTPWQAEANILPQERAAASAVVHRLDEDTSMLYVVGGHDADFVSMDTVYRAQVNNHTGQVGVWMTDSVRLPAGLHSASVVEHDGNLYVIGGFGFPAGNAYQEVYYAPIQADGSLSPTIETSSLPKPLHSGYAVVYDGNPTDTLYFIGGFDQETEVATSTVRFADFQEGGGLKAEWQRSEGSLPVHLFAHSGVIVNQRDILVIGGVANPTAGEYYYTGNVRAALVDPGNPSFRLYDWCLDVPPPTCTIGAWQTNGLLPENEVRALHGTVEGQDYIYVVGGEGINPGETTPKPRDTVFIGNVSGVDKEALYSPEGVYLSDQFDLGQPAKLKRLDWHATIGHPGRMGMTMAYRTKPEGEPDWSEWSVPMASQNMTNQMEIAPSLPEIRHVQYRASFTTAVTNASPLLDWVHIYYEVPDPDLSVAKDTGSVITVGLGSALEYSIRYTNTGGWVAEGVILTETLPENTSYVPSPGWHQVDSTDLYTYYVGDVERGTHGSVPFQVQVAETIPPETHFITNRVETDYPPMIDAFNQTIVDPQPDDNWYVFSNPLSFFGLAISKEAEPPAGVTVTPGSRITYTIRYTNVGAVRASQVVLTDTFDELGNYSIIAPSYIPTSASEHVWDLSGLSPQETHEVSVVVQLDDPMPNHWIVTNRASLDSLEGYPYHTPVITHPVMNLSGGQLVPMVDLAINDVNWQPLQPTSGTWPVFTATVTNLGDADAEDAFWLALYIKPQGAEPPEWPYDHDQGYCLNACSTVRRRYVEQVPSLAAGSSVEIPFLNLDEDPSPEFPATGSYEIYIQVDVAFGSDNPYWGSIAEDDEKNNIWHGLMTIPPGGPEPNEPPKAYLPIILKGSP